MQRRILFPIAFLLVALVGFLARWCLSGSGTPAMLPPIEVAAQAPLAEETFELTPVAIETPEVFPSDRRVPEPPKKLIPVSELAPQEMTLLLRHPDGRPLFATLDAFDRETATALRPVLLEMCPRVGADLPLSARKLRHKTTDVHTEHPDSWMRSFFKQPTCGCAAVVLGERVIAAEAFSVDQPTVALTVRPDDLRAARGTLEILVLDDQSFAPIQGAEVTLRHVLDRRKVVITDSRGKVSWPDVLPGDVFAAVAHASYRRANRTITVSPGRDAAVETFELSRKALIAGRVRWLASDPPPANIVLWGVGSDTPVTKAIERDRTGWTGKFRFDGLKAGEYMVGVVDTGEFPSVDAVRRREVEGWTLVDVRFRDAEGVWIEVTQTRLEGSAKR